MEQRTDEWFAVRCGKVTASRIADVVARTKTGYGASRANYMAELVVERLTNTRAESYTSAAMRWGIDQEPAARDAYSARTGELVTEIGFIPHPRIAMAGASPDALVGVDGMVETKCPNTASHIEYMMEGEPAHEYFLQMQWQMACANRQWNDFCSYDPRMPEGLQLFIVRVPRDDSVIEMLEAEVEKFLAELDVKVKTLEALKHGI